MMALLLAVNAVSMSAAADASFELDGRWEFSNGPEFPGAEGALEELSGGGARLDFDFTGGGNYVAAYYHLDKPAPLGEFRFEAKKPLTAQLTLRVRDHAGQSFQKTVFAPREDWTSYAASMDGWVVNWGGPNDGIFRQPVASVCLIVDKVGMTAETGAVWLRNLRGAPPAEGAPFEMAQTAGSYAVSDFRSDATPWGVEGGALRDGVWTIDFSKADAARLTNSISLFGQPDGLALRLESDTPGVEVRLQLGSHFQTFARSLGSLEQGAQTLTAPAPPEGWRHFGGENDGVVRMPLRVTHIIAEQGSAPATEVTLRLKELGCETSVPPAEALIAMVDVAPSEGDSSLVATATAWNLSGATRQGTVRIELADWSGAGLAARERQATLPAGGERVALEETFELPADRNFAEVSAAWTAPELPEAKAAAGYARPLSPPDRPVLRPDSPWGMGVYLYRYPHTERGLAEMERGARLAAAAGVKWSREEFSWHAIEREEGVYDFAHLDAVVDTALRNGISVYGLLTYWSEHTAAYTEQGVDEWVEWARATVRHFKDRVKVWELYNEPNIFFWSGPKELYPVLVKKAYAAVKEEDPEADVLAISTAGIDTAFIDYCMEAGAPFDGLTIHPYRHHLHEEGFMAELRKAKEQVGGRPVWITEMGWPTSRGGAPERKQARLLARTYLSAVASGACRSVSWYNFRNDGTDPFYNEHNFGVLRRDFTPKPAYRALATICRTLSGGEPELLEGFGEHVYALRMGDATALWAPIRRVQLPCRVTGSPRYLNLMGESVRPATDGGGVTTFDLSPGRPLFLQGGAVQPAGVPSYPEEGVEGVVVRF